MKGKAIFKAVAMICLMAGFSGHAWAKDNVQAEVSSTSPTALVTPNGMAVGTIHVIFTLNAYEFTPGNLGSFDIDLSILNSNQNPETSYPLSLILVQKQRGDENLILTPEYDFFDVATSGWGGDSTTVAVNIPENPSNEDGTTLTGILQFEADGPLGSNGRTTNPQIGTITTIVVKVVLLHPTACLKVMNFVTDMDFNALDSTVVNLKTKNGSTTINSTNPGQFSDNILVVNNCDEAQEIDLRIGLDTCFDTNPSGNPGNAVFSYLTEGEVDEESFDISAFGSKTNQGQNLCLSGLTIPTGQTLLATVHMGTIKGASSGDLPGDSSFDFEAEVYDVGSNNCTNGYPHGMTDYNPVGTSVPFTTK
jgi:hypothetical protein